MSGETGCTGAVVGLYGEAGLLNTGAVLWHSVERLLNTGTVLWQSGEAVEQWSVLWSCLRGLLNSGQCCGVVCRGC